MRQNIDPVTVLGAGSWGTALAIVLARNGNPTRLWGHNPKHVHQLQNQRCNQHYLPGHDFPDCLNVFDSLDDALDGVNDIVIAVPSHAFGQLLIKITPHFHQHSRLLSATKGLDPQSGTLLSDLVDQLDNKPGFSVLSGPSFANEVAANLPTAMSLACDHDDQCQAWIKRFANPYLRVYSNNDLIGVQLCGAMKNVFAIACGIADGLGMGANARCALITRGLNKMRTLGVAMGAKAETFTGLAGMGDLILSCTDNQSRNRRFGLAIGQGKSVQAALDEIGQVVEGYQNAKQVWHLAQYYQCETPICQQVYQILYQQQPVSQAVAEILSRELRAE